MTTKAIIMPNDIKYIFGCFLFRFIKVDQKGNFVFFYIIQEKKPIFIGFEDLFKQKERLYHLRNV